MTCGECRGTGEVLSHTIPINFDDGEELVITATCPVCLGIGALPHTHPNEGEQRLPSWSAIIHLFCQEVFLYPKRKGLVYASFIHQPLRTTLV